MKEDHQIGKPAVCEAVRSFAYHATKFGTYSFGISNY
jgi:hypothetical protein